MYARSFCIVTARITKPFPAFSGSSCRAIGRSLGRRRRARRPPSGTALLRKRNVLRLSGSPGTYPTAALWSLNGSCLLPFCASLLRSGRLCRLSRALGAPLTPRMAYARVARTPPASGLCHTLHQQGCSLGAFNLRLVNTQ